MSGIKEVIRVLGFIQEYFDNHADEQEPNERKELFVDWSDTVLEAITLLKAQDARHKLEIHNIGNVDIPEGVTWGQFQAVMDGVVAALEHTDKGESWPYDEDGEVKRD